MEARRNLIMKSVLGVLSLAAVSTARADLIFLHVPGVTGTVTTTGFVGDIAILSYSQGFSNSGTGSTPQCSDVAFQKSIDVTSQYFSRRVLEQAGPFTATLYFVDQSTLVAYTTIILHNAVVTSIEHSGAVGGGAVSESLSIYATSQTVTFTSGGTTNSYTATCAALP
jgi:type VI protein secretion system component Hcp